jgi:hypothetical protein
MADQWYYWNGSEFHGPFSGRHLISLAAGGKVLADDIVWQEGVERGVPARTVKHLFPPTPSGEAHQPPGGTNTLSESQPVAVPVAEDTAECSMKTDPGTRATAATAAADGIPTSVQGQGGSYYYPPIGKGRAVAGKGAVIVGQDGTTVKFRMKCTACGHEDSSWRSAPITRGTTRSSFFCPKCRKRREVEVHGHLT